MAIQPAAMPPSPASMSHSFQGNGWRRMDKIPATKQAIRSALVFSKGITIAINVKDIANVKDHCSDIKVAPKTQIMVASCNHN